MAAAAASAALQFDPSPSACAACFSTSGQEEHTRQSAQVDAVRWHPACDENLVESTCTLCGEGSEKGILQRLKADECEQLKLPPVRAQADSATRFAHTFCLNIFRQNPSKPTDCRLCGKPSARLSCELCSTSFHPTCAVGHKSMLRYSKSGNVLCYCDQHADAATAAPARSSAAAAAAVSSSSSHKPITVKREPGANGSAIAAASSPVPPASAHSAAAPSKSSAAAAHVPTMKPAAKSSQPPAKAATPSAVPKAASTSLPSKPASSSSAAKPSAVPAAAAASSAKFIPAAKPPAEMKSASAAKPSVASPKLALKPTTNAAKPSSVPAAAAAAAASTKPAAAAAAAAAASSPKPSAPVARTSISSLKPASPAKPSKPKASAAAPAAAASSSSSSAAAAASSSSSSSAAAASSKPASKPAAAPAPKPAPKPSSSFRPPAAAAAASAPSGPHFTSHPDAAGHAMTDSDEGEAEFTGVSVSSTEEQQERAADRALREIKHANKDAKALSEDACRVCGEVWEEFHEDADHNPILDEHGKTQHDELVICEGCDFPYHQSCYGIKEVPDDDYYCWACKADKKPGEIKCVICASREWRGFCNVKYDRSKTDAQTLHDHRRNPHFAHTACAHWMPPCEFGKAEERNPATRIEEIPKGAFNLSCKLCNRKGGAKLQCQYKECVLAMHVLCAIDHASALGATPPTIFMDDRALENDVLDTEGNWVRPNKLYYCAWHSKIPLLKRKRQELIEAEESTEDIDVEIQVAELEQSKVVPSKGLLPASKLVSVPPLSGRRRKPALEVDATDEEERHAKFEEGRKQALADLEIKDSIKAEKLKSDPDGGAAAAAGGGLAGSKRKQKSIIDADVESVESDSDREDADMASLQSGSEASEPHPAPKKHKRLHKVAKLTLTSANSDREALAAEEHELQISTQSNANIDARRSMRASLERVLGEADLGTNNQLSVAVEKALFLVCKSTTDAKYRERGIDICSNLKANADLRRQLQSGDLSPDELANMTSAEMATTAQKQQREEESKQATREATAASHVGVMKDGRFVALDPSTLRRVDSSGGSSNGAAAAAAGGSPITKRSKSTR